MASKKVSTKCNFEEGEKVLCYEPDPLKTKVLYDSKVLKVVPEKDDQGRKFFKFLIHFQGWNSTWDRYVTDEFILKDTEENRKLQKKLAEEAQLTPGGHLYKKERKKRVKTEPKPLVIDPADNSIDDKSMVEPDKVSVLNEAILFPKRNLPDLEFPDNLKQHVGYNCYLAHEKNNLIQLPCRPNVVMLLEGYLKYLARNNFYDCTSTKKKTRQSEAFDLLQLEKRYNICIEVLDGMRICFNTFMYRKEEFTLLVCEDELAQYYEALKMNIQPPTNNIPQYENGEQEHVSNGESSTMMEFNDNESKREKPHSVSSQCSQSQKNRSDFSLTKAPCSKFIQEMFDLGRDEYVRKADSWKAVPDSVYNENTKQPAIIYGVYHLLRLLENMPEILSYTEVHGEKLSIIYSYCNGLLNYLSTQHHLFGMQCYIKNQMDEIQPGALIQNHKNQKDI